MAWRFVGRSEQLDQIRRSIAEARPGPVVVLGEPGMGRSRLVTEALETADPSRDAVLRIEPEGPAPFAALTGLLAAGFRPSLRTGITDAAGALADLAGGRRLVLVLDDAHRADQASMQVLRHLYRTRGAVLLITAASDNAVLPPGPDALDCLRYEPGTRTLRLPPLSVDDVAGVLADELGGPVRSATATALHAATGGNPGQLRTLARRCRLADRTVVTDGTVRLDPGHTTAVAEAAPPAAGLAERVTAAVGAAWRDLALDRVHELCMLAVWCGVADRVATMWAGVLLLRGRADDGLRVLDLHAGAGPRATITRALILALGLRRGADADTLLLDAAHADAANRDRYLACRDWLLASIGARPVTLSQQDDPVTDRETAAFGRAALGVIALTAGRCAEAVAHLRRALVAADRLRADLPWFPPYLTAHLIDALLLCGRTTEATKLATEFHAGQQDRGWPVAVALDALIDPRPVPAPLTA